MKVGKHEAHEFETSVEMDSSSHGAGGMINRLTLKHASFHELIIICPTNPVYGVFKTCVVLACMGSSILYAYYAAFRYDVDGYWCPEGTYSPADAATKGFSIKGLTPCETFEARQDQVDAIQLTS